MNCRICGAVLPEGAMFCGDCGSSTAATPESRQRADERPRDTVVVEPIVGGSAAPRHSAAAGGAEAASGFEFRFSTGETTRISGSGLIGRRPLPQPGERFEHVIHVADRGLTVSKTHLEFGEDAGALWVSDRFSSNGTVIHRTDGSVVRCEPGHRYPVGRGSRVEIGEQHFLVY